MVQKHDATRLHYDFRLELDGVLKSWAVTRGPSLDPADKRLAVRTEDHPLSYATFEGTIPKGEYGGGTVMLWDRGTWTPEPGKDPRKTIEEGHLHFTLDGERMKGEWVMFRLKPRGKGARRELDPEEGRRRVCRQPDRADRHVSDLGQDRPDDGRDRGGEEGRRSPRRKPGQRGRQRRAPGLRRDRRKFPKFREPQKATLVDAVPAGAGWLHEMKYDGYRCLLALAGGEAQDLHPHRARLDRQIPGDRRGGAARSTCDSALLDGEIVALDDKGNTGFSALQQAIGEGGRGLTLFLFDALEIDGEKLDKLPNIERKQRLAALLGDGAPPFILYADHIVGKGEQLFEAMCAAGQEGIISKKADAPYRGARTKNWLKVKCTRRQEFVIIGWSESDKKGRGFRSLLLGAQREAASCATPARSAPASRPRVQHELRARLDKLAARQGRRPTCPAPRRAARIG